jgi:hypothetical protein
LKQATGFNKPTPAACQGLAMQSQAAPVLVPWMPHPLIQLSLIQWIKLS